MIIDYKNLLNKYDENLLSKLRGFGEEEFLKNFGYPIQKN